MTPEFDRAILFDGRGPLRLRGHQPDALQEVRRGQYALIEDWGALFVEGRLRTLAEAVLQRAGSTDAALSHTAALAKHGLPVYRGRSDRIDVTVPGPSGRHNSSDVRRHQAPLPERDVVVIDGARVTSLDRTIYDVIRTARLETAVVAFDAALRRVGWDASTNTYDPGRADAFRRRVSVQILAHPGARGVRQARFVAEFADGRADRPGESTSRLWMWQLGIPTPELQYRVDLPGGRYALLDFAWPGRRRWAEFDGAFKYTDEQLLDGRSAEQVLAEQQARQREVEQVTGWRCDRWGFERMPSLDEFAHHLRSIGLRPF